MAQLAEVVVTPNLARKSGAYSSVGRATDF